LAGSNSHRRALTSASTQACTVLSFFSAQVPIVAKTSCGAGLSFSKMNLPPAFSSGAL
jgi:hypothetical protein